ncbi:MAG TPA: CBS domain-containing protein [Pyrinomonadaceae bacterium]|nr:CBS domain-containing protein [Pyrinomonadaceae bacterium]
MTVAEIMTKDPACCSPDTSLREVAKMMVDNDCGCIPIVEDGEPIGTITDRDIAVRTVAEGKNPLDLTASDAMTPNVVSVKTDCSLEECCQVMEDHQIRRVLVVDDAGVCCGIIAQADIAAAAPPKDVAEVVQEVSKSAGV